MEIEGVAGEAWGGGVLFGAWGTGVGVGGGGGGGGVGLVPRGGRGAEDTQRWGGRWGVGGRGVRAGRRDEMVGVMGRVPWGAFRRNRATPPAAARRPPRVMSVQANTADRGEVGR